MSSYPNWFAAGGSPAQSYFARNTLKFRNRKNVQALQLGVYTGDASVWLLENVLIREGSWLTDVDTWQGSDEPLMRFDFDDIYGFYLSRMKPYKNVTPCRMTTDQFFAGAADDTYDFVYVDADHHEEQVMYDIINADRVLKVGGTLALDDVNWCDGDTQACQNYPNHSILHVTHAFRYRYRVIDGGDDVNQKWMVKHKAR